MTTKELIDSGVLEMYCLGIASDEDRLTVEALIESDEETKKEFLEISQALMKYSSAFSSSMKNELRKQIFERLEQFPKLPTFLNESSSASEWLQYLSALEMKPPTNLQGIEVEEIEMTSNSITLVLWGAKGGIIPDEEHIDLNEHLLFCAGSCEMTIDGLKKTYRAGDYLRIQPHHIHSGIVTSDEPMIAIVQRRAA